jgi:hypothetical protein
VHLASRCCFACQAPAIIVVPLIWSVISWPANEAFPFQFDHWFLFLSGWCWKRKIAPHAHETPGRNHILTFIGQNHQQQHHNLIIIFIIIVVMPAIIIMIISKNNPLKQPEKSQLVEI